MELFIPSVALGSLLSYISILEIKANDLKLGLNPSSLVQKIAGLAGELLIGGGKLLVTGTVLGTAVISVASCTLQDFSMRNEVFLVSELLIGLSLNLLGRNIRLLSRT